MPFLCGPDGAIEVDLKDQDGGDCLIEVEGQLLWVSCAALVSSADDCQTDSSELKEGTKVVFFARDDAQNLRLWPAEVSKAYQNGKFQIELEGIGLRHSVDATTLLYVRD